MSFEWIVVWCALIWSFLGLIGVLTEHWDTIQERFPYFSQLIWGTLLCGAAYGAIYLLARLYRG